jgi:hypothetical protein
VRPFALSHHTTGEPIMKKLFAAVLLATSLASVQALAATNDNGRKHARTHPSVTAHFAVRTNFTSTHPGRHGSGNPSMASVSGSFGGSAHGRMGATGAAMSGGFGGSAGGMGGAAGGSTGGSAGGMGGAAGGAAGDMGGSAGGSADGGMGGGLF